MSKLMSIKLVMPSNHLILCRLLLLLPSIFPSIRVFSNESVLCIRWPKYWSFNFSISLSNEYSGLIRLSDFGRHQRALGSLGRQHGPSSCLPIGHSLFPPPESNFHFWVVSGVLARPEAMMSSGRCSPHIWPEQVCVCVLTFDLG